MLIVYALGDPDTSEVRYVGLTSRDINIRIREHTRRGRHVGTWLRSLGRPPTHFILEECDAREEANTAECFWISWYRRNTCFRLCNHSAGGEGSAPRNPHGPKRRTAEHNRKISEALKGRNNTWGHKVSASLRRYHAHRD